MKNDITYKFNEEEGILIERSPEFYRIAKQLSEHIARLPLSVPDNASW